MDPLSFESSLDFTPILTNASRMGLPEGGPVSNRTEDVCLHH
jgi:hypothetical protein